MWIFPSCPLLFSFKPNHEVQCGYRGALDVWRRASTRLRHHFARGFFDDPTPSPQVASSLAPGTCSISSSEILASNARRSARSEDGALLEELGTVKTNQLILRSLRLGGNTTKRSRAAEVHNQSLKELIHVLMCFGSLFISYVIFSCSGKRDSINEIRALQELIPNSNKAWLRRTSFVTL